MTMFIISCALVGAVLGLRFRVFILLPIVLMLICCIAVIAAVRGDHLWAIIFTVIPSVVSLQVGYFCGSLADFILEDLREQRRAFRPLASAADRTIDESLARIPDRAMSG